MPVSYASRLYLRQLAPNSLKSKTLSFQLMRTNSLIAQTNPGFFCLLPLGQRVMDKLVRVVDERLAAVGAQKMEVPALAASHFWEQSGRWEVFGSEMFRLMDRNKTHFCLQPTAEEMMTFLVQNLGIVKESMLPIMLYQTSQKFRDEMNPRFGLIRSRQFLMNDLYSFDPDQRSAQITYEAVTHVYRTLFQDVLELKPHVRRVQAASGAMGGSVSHEFHLPNPSAEDILLRCAACGTEVKKDEARRDSHRCPQCAGEMSELETVEVAHTFQLGETYSKVFDAKTPNGNPFFMCCFGLGLSRIIAASIDCLSVSNKAMRLPEVIAPFSMAILLPKEETVNSVFVQSFMHELDKFPHLRNNILIDDRSDRSIGRRLKDMNQLGIPHILVASSHKFVDPFAVQKVEYHRALAHTDELEKVADLSHAELFSLFSSP